MFNQDLIIIPEKEKLLQNPNLCKTIITDSKHIYKYKMYCSIQWLMGDTILEVPS